MTSWPFSTAELTAGLRRYFAEPSLQVRAVHEVPMGSEHVRGLRVEYDVREQTFAVQCVVKEPQGSSRPGLAGTGLREAGLYRSLAAQLPVATPALVAADPAGHWLVLETVEAEIPPEGWQPDDCRRAVQALAALHERFWELGDDLANYPWLARPLTSDYEVYVFAAAQTVEKLVLHDWPPLITGSVRVLNALAGAIQQIETVVAALRAAPQTLLHGDFWPGNVALQSDGEMVVYDWQQAGVGPGVLDLVAFLTKTRWELGGLPVPDEELIALYRAELEQRVGVRWPDEEWTALWDFALLWRFVQETLGWLASMPAAAFDTRAAQFDAVWLTPVVAAAERRLRPELDI